MSKLSLHLGETDVELYCGAWQDVLAEATCDALIVDPPYSERTHSGNNAKANKQLADKSERRAIEYAAWSPEEARAFAQSWAGRTAGWMCIFTDHVLFRHYEEALLAAGRCVFQPIPCVTLGGGVRLAGDGPSSWTTWLCVSRPRGEPYSKWGTLRGAYVVPRRPSPYPGAKQRNLMGAVIRDYTRPRDIVCDPCMGSGTTGFAARAEGRHFVGAEMDPEVFELAKEQLMRPYQQKLI